MSAIKKRTKEKIHKYISTLIHDSDFQALRKYYAKIFCAT